MYQYFQASCSWDVSYHQVAHIPETVASRVRYQTLDGGPQSKCPPSRHWNQQQTGLHSAKSKNLVAAPSRNASMLCHLVLDARTGMLQSPISVGRIIDYNYCTQYESYHLLWDVWIAYTSVIGSHILDALRESAVSQVNPKPPMSKTSLSIITRQLTSLSTNSCFVRCNMCSLQAHCFV